MGARRQWTATALLVLGAEVVVFIWLELAFGVSGLVHEALTSGGSVVVSALVALIPSWLGDSLGVLASSLGFAWFYQHLVAPSFTGSTGVGYSTLAGALVAPIYFGVRRLFLSPTKDREAASPTDEPAPEPQMAKAFEPPEPVSTAVQEPL